MTAPPSHLRDLREARTRRRLEVARLMRDAPNVTDVELAEALNVSRNTIREDRLALMQEITQDTRSEVQVYRDEHIAELEKLRTQLQDFLIPPEKRIELALKIIAQDAKLKGTEAPTKSIHANVSGPQLDTLYLEIRQILLPLEEADREEALRLCAEFAKGRKKPVIVDAMPLQPLGERSLTDGELS